MSTEKSNFNTLAREMYRRAIATTAWQLGVKSPLQVVEELRHGDCDKCQILRNNLARQIAEYLATCDPSLRAVYTYNPDYAFGDYQSTGAKQSLSSALYLMAWTRTLKSLPKDAIEKLAQAFHDARKAIACPQSSEMCLNLVLKVVSDAQVKTRQGYGALVESLNVRPNQVWARETLQRRPMAGAMIQH